MLNITTPKTSSSKHGAPVFCVRNAMKGSRLMQRVPLCFACWLSVVCLSVRRESETRDQRWELPISTSNGQSNTRIRSSNYWVDRILRSQFTRHKKSLSPKSLSFPPRLFFTQDHQKVVCARFVVIFELIIACFARPLALVGFPFINLTSPAPICCLNQKSSLKKTNT